MTADLGKEDPDQEITDQDLEVVDLDKEDQGLGIHQTWAISY